MGNKNLADTNIIIYFLKDELPGNYLDFFDDSFAVSIVSKIEFLGWRGFDNETYNEAKDFLENVRIIILNDDIVEKTIQLKRKFKIKTPDAIIAATCLVENRNLITRNTKDFERISDLKIINPFL